MGLECHEALATAIDDLFALEPADLTDDELHRCVVAVQRQSHRLAAVRAKLVERWNDRRIWASDGSRSGGHRLARETSMPVAAGKAEVRRATALRTMPATTAALAAGDLSPHHVDLLSEANGSSRRSLFEAHEDLLVEQCRRLRFADAVKVVEYWKQRADVVAANDEADRRHESRNASASKTYDGMVDVRALLDPVGGEALLAELARLMERMRVKDLADGVTRTAKQRRADALVEMAHRSRSAKAGSRRPRPLIVIHAGERTAAYLCELASGTVIAPGQIVPFLADADIERIIYDGPNRVMSVSKKRKFTGAVRRAIEARDRHCQHPSGCDEPADRCDVDHIVPFSQGGETSEANGRLSCWPHNRHDDLRNAHPPEPRSADPPHGNPPVDEPDDLDGRSPPAAA